MDSLPVQQGRIQAEPAAQTPPISRPLRWAIACLLPVILLVQLTLVGYPVAGALTCGLLALMFLAVAYLARKDAEPNLFLNLGVIGASAGGVLGCALMPFTVVAGLALIYLSGAWLCFCDYGSWRTGEPRWLIDPAMSIRVMVAMLMLLLVGIVAAVS